MVETKEMPTLPPMIAHQVLDAGGVADLIVAQSRQPDGGQRHKNEAGAKTADRDWVPEG